MSSVPVFVDLPIETDFLFLNLSRQSYASIQLREHTADTDLADAPFSSTPLLAPGAALRGRFLDLIGSACPQDLDLRIMLYRRTNDDLPIGLDAGEQVDVQPVVAGEVLNLPACSVATLAAYTIVNWDAPEGTARVKIAQDTAVDDEIRRSGRFDNIDAAWEVVGVSPELADSPPPVLAESVPVGGRVTLADGTGVERVGVLLRTRFRTRLDDSDVTNDPDVGFADPIAFTETDADGGFAFERPPGAYQVEFFSDDYLFRPPDVIVELPIEQMIIVAEPR